MSDYFYEKQNNSALPAIAANNMETSSIDLNKTYNRKSSKVASGISKKENILNKSNTTNSDYDDMSKVRAQINQYKENMAKTIKLSKPINFVDSFYSLTAYGINGKHVKFSSLNECVILVVNIATCDPRTTEELKQVRWILHLITIIIFMNEIINLLF
jgi:hypothetical protein